VEVNQLSNNSKEYPQSLKHIASSPSVLYHRGASLSELLKRPRLAIIGSRSVSPYGREITARLAREMAEQGVVIISGLAIGVDAIAHQAALDAGGLTIAVLPSPVDDPYPASNARLAERIIEKGGALISEYPDNAFAFKTNFVARNRLVAGLAQAILITEAAEKSGSLHTARFALEQGKDVLAVPGNITSISSVGTNNLIKAGATPVTSYLDILFAMGLKPHYSKARHIVGRTANEQRIIDFLLQGSSDGDILLKLSDLSIPEFNQAMTMLEVGAKIRSLGYNQWSLY
jgi:DNA processing protein